MTRGKAGYDPRKAAEERRRLIVADLGQFTGQGVKLTEQNGQVLGVGVKERLAALILQIQFG